MIGSDVVERALRIVEDTLEVDVATRDTYVEQQCGHDARLRREVGAILEHAGGVEILATPPVKPPPEIPSRYDGEDRYDLHEEIARGAVGQILRATDRDLGREVALKVLLDSGRNDAEVLRRFLTEARIEAWLQHPGVPAVHEVGRLADGRPFIAMKLVRGRTLRSTLADREFLPADLSNFLSIFERVCQTMAFAHAYGVIHRDLKPDNIMVGAFGEVQVMDWGLATFVADSDLPVDGLRPIEPGRDGTSPKDVAPGPALAASELFQTRVCGAMGTPAYMPPEQFEGRRGKRGDVFALGAILCEILTGAPPYTGETPADVLARSALADLEETMARLEECGANDQLVRLARRCLEIDPDRRPTDAGEIAEAIHSYRGSIESRAHAAEIAAARAEETVRQERRQRLRCEACVLRPVEDSSIGRRREHRAADGMRRGRP